jgi:hypothetical protein
MSVMGFIHAYPTAQALLDSWSKDQQMVLARHSAALRAAGQKAWNVYSIFLTQEPAPQAQRAADQIEEDFSLTRKIARTSVRTPEDIEKALLPLTSVRAQPLLGESKLEDRLRQKLKDLPESAVTAFFGPVPAEEVARILSARP